MPMIDWCSGLGTNSYTLFLSNWFNSSCIAIIQDSSFSAFEKDFGSIWDMNASYWQVFLNDDLVGTPLEGSPKISSLGWEETYLHSLGSVSEIPYCCSIFISSSCLPSWFSCGAFFCLSFDDSSYNSSSIS